MNDIQTCTACNHIGYDVRTRIVEAPEGTTEVLFGHVVPVRFRSEPRCLDRTACDDRQYAKEEPANA